MKGKQSRKDRKRERKYGRNPVTGEIFTKQGAKQFRKYGIDPESGILRSKFDASNKAVRHGRNEVKKVRAETGNTFLSGLANMFGGDTATNNEGPPPQGFGSWEEFNDYLEYKD